MLIRGVLDGPGLVIISGILDGDCFWFWERTRAAGVGMPVEMMAGKSIGCRRDQ